MIIATKKDLKRPHDMSTIKSAAKFVVLMVVGLVTIVVGSFMLRGIMHLWDKQKKPGDDR
jgi:ABC-type branched-subunit amino acid transport system permease subunit